MSVVHIVYEIQTVSENRRGETTRNLNLSYTTDIGLKLNFIEDFNQIVV